MIWVKCSECDYDATYDIVGRFQSWYLCELCLKQKESKEMNEHFKCELINGR